MGACRIGLMLQPADNKPKDTAAESTGLGRFTAGDVSTVDELEVGMTVKARVLSVGETQMNLVLGPAAKGRVHLSSVRDTDASGLDAAAEAKHPFDAYEVGKTIQVKVVGFNESAAGERTAELSVRPSDLALKPEEPLPPRLTVTSIKKGQTVIGYVTQVFIFVWAQVDS